MAVLALVPALVAATLMVLSGAAEGGAPPDEVCGAADSCYGCLDRGRGTLCEWSMDRKACLPRCGPGDRCGAKLVARLKTLEKEDEEESFVKDQQYCPRCGNSFGACGPCVAFRGGSKSDEVRCMWDFAKSSCIVYEEEVPPPPTVDEAAAAEKNEAEEKAAERSGAPTADATATAEEKPAAAPAALLEAGAARSGRRKAKRAAAKMSAAAEAAANKHIAPAAAAQQDKAEDEPAARTAAAGEKKDKAAGAGAAEGDGDETDGTDGLVADSPEAEKKRVRDNKKLERASVGRLPEGLGRQPEHCRAFSAKTNE